MKTIPNSIRKKLESYHMHIQKSEKLRNEIEDWFLKNGVDTDIDGEDLKGHMITDVIVDTGHEGDINEAIILMENIINNK